MCTLEVEDEGSYWDCHDNERKMFINREAPCIDVGATDFSSHMPHQGNYLVTSGSPPGRQLDIHIL